MAKKKAKKIVVGSKVKGSGHFKHLSGKVIKMKDTGFGFRYALVEPSPDDDVQWANVTYLTAS